MEASVKNTNQTRLVFVREEYLDMLPPGRAKSQHKEEALRLLGNKNRRAFLLHSSHLADQQRSTNERAQQMPQHIYNDDIRP